MSFNICPCFYTACQSSHVSCLIRSYVIILRNYKHCRVLRAHICATVTINTLTKQQIYTQTQRLALQTNTQTHPVACSHFCPLCCPSRRQWWLFSKLTPPTKACDHLSCHLASAETTNQTTVRVALKISPQKMCHLHMLFRTQWHIFHFYFCSFACGKLYLQRLGKCQTVLYVWHRDVMCGSLLQVHVKSFWLKINYIN